MKNRKGFTLIELLAVIVILAVIMVIAVPQILNVIESSKRSAASSSIKLVKDAIKTQVSTSGMSGVNFDKGKDGCYLFDFDNSNRNASKLSLKNKEKIGGSVKYCDGKFKEDNIIFDGKIVKVCKRAASLHEETCGQTSTSAYCSGAGYTESGSKGTKTIVYGNDPETRESGKLTSGDAFDCDVDGNGKYDEDERFYYVTDLEENPNYAVLIYYNNVSGGNPSNNTTYAYNLSGENWQGPLTAIQQLPTVSQWTNENIVLNNNGIRTIKYENGENTLSSNFSYEVYAARLLTYQEMTSACGPTGIASTGYLDNCNYLLENTNYSSNNIINMGYWLENPQSASSNKAWYVIGYYRRNDTYDSMSDSRYYGVRPVIEVLKTNISY